MVTDNLLSDVDRLRLDSLHGDGDRLSGRHHMVNLNVDLLEVHAGLAGRPWR